MSKKHSHYRFVPMVLLLAVVSLPITLAEQAVNPPLPLPGKSIPQFKQALPLLDVAGGTIQTVLDTNFEMQMCEFKASVLPPGTPLVSGDGKTYTWGYYKGGACPAGARDTFTGPVVVATQGYPRRSSGSTTLGPQAAPMSWPSSRAMTRRCIGPTRWAIWPS